LLAELKIVITLTEESTVNRPSS